jgi:hypothetical protein
MVEVECHVVMSHVLVRVDCFDFDVVLMEVVVVPDVEVFGYYLHSTC